MVRDDYYNREPLNAVINVVFSGEDISHIW